MMSPLVVVVIVCGVGAAVALGLAFYWLAQTHRIMKSLGAGSIRRGGGRP